MSLLKNPSASWPSRPSTSLSKEYSPPAYNMSSDLILLGVSLMTWGVGEAAFFIFQPLYLQQLGASPVTIGAIYMGVGIAMTIAHIPAGHLADRIGRRQLL